MGAYNVVNYGARPDGRTDSAKAFLGAWADACGSSKPATIYVPAGSFFVSQALFQGPCKNFDIKIDIDGTIVASSDYRGGVLVWLTFKYVDGLSIFGGTLDGQGQAFWACKTAGGNCPSGTTSLSIGMSKNVLISGLTTTNSKGFHISIFGSNGVTVQGAKIIAPGNSPNTDGIHIQMSSGVTVTSSSIKTGDDCISIGEGTSNVWIEKIGCGPGHGISIGSLGGTPLGAGVQNITVKSVVFTGTQNGLRIKTWGKAYSGFVKDVTFEHAVMQNVQNPIVVDQNYCPGAVNCPGQSSGIKISGLSYTDIQGSSATQLAVKFDCSPSNPCGGIKLQDIRLTYQNQQAQSYCKNADGSASGFVIPPSCL
ncbi:polygalacturonase-like [Ananas comosus]|uniref:Exopolygalacturonase n=1 Tax=Ananas comosus TaxID=4615 RepID=A0A6P5EAQ4_ANACO|nr:polygalacturonase-like [Ananas comosus]